MFKQNLTHRKVLVIEDDEAIVRMLRMSLRSSGFDTARAESGREALTAMDEGEFDAVILDLCLPDGRGGDVLQRLQAAGHCPAWVVMSALDEDEAVRRYGPLQGPFLPKPFDPWDLIRLLDHLLGNGSHGRQQQVAGAAS
jgi:DNA-binding response OmpR family regulator